MKELIDSIGKIHTTEEASQFLLSQVQSHTQDIQFAIDYASKAHKGQFRKSGEEYIIHPILVASIVNHLGGDKAMVISAILHDVVEDTPHTIEDIENTFGHEVKDLVDGLTKIDKIREENLLPSSKIDEKLMKSAMTFRKMLLKAIEDIRILVIKLCDRTHNIITLDALSEKKQKRIAEETLVVYAPIAHRLGISKLKNILEDKSFYYIFPEEYQYIDKHITGTEQKLDLKLNEMINALEHLLRDNGFTEEMYEINSRIKHRYSIYLKLQRKGIAIDEVLDLLAIRIIVKDTIECYKVLGLLHTNYKPLVARFKDYIAIPKDNGYQTIHTTVFNNGNLFEVQIRTEEMHNTAELGVAAHWKYKSGGLSPKTSWLKGISEHEVQDLEFYENAKGELYTSEISVYTPQGDVYGLPLGATALDFAYAIHTEIGEKARGCLINKKPQPLLTKLKNGDFVSIQLSKKKIPRCTWISAVKTVRAKNHIRHACNQRLKEINRLAGLSILSNFLMVNYKKAEKFIEKENLEDLLHKIPNNKSVLNEVISKFKKKLFLIRPPIEFFRQRDYEFDNLIITSNRNVSEIHFDHCCHPKFGDDIIAILYKKGKAIIHHKQCEHAYNLLCKEANSLMIRWAGVNNIVLRISVILDNKKGTLATFVTFLAQEGVNITDIHVGGAHYIESPTKCEVVAEFPNKLVEKIKEKLHKKFKVVEIVETKDAYKG